MQGAIQDQYVPAPPKAAERPEDSFDLLTANPGVIRTLYTRDDKGNADAVLDRWGGNFLFMPDRREFIVWNGTHWEVDITNEVGRWIDETFERREFLEEEANRAEREGLKEGVGHWAREPYKEWSKEEQDQYRKDVAAGHTHWRSSRSTKRWNATKERLRSMATKAYREFDSVDSGDPRRDLVNFTNGTLDLSPERNPVLELREHRREDFLTRCIPFAYNPEAEAPQWQAYLAEVQPSEDVRIFLKKLGGLLLSGRNPRSQAFFLYGTGANGKTVFMSVPRMVLGDYAAATSAETLFSRKDGQHREDIARLQGVRFAYCAEFNENAPLNEAQVKSLTGGDPITARYLYEGSFEFVPEFKTVLGTNYLPRVKGADNGIWRRVVPIKWPVEIPPERQNANLAADIVEAEAEGVLAWMVQGARLAYMEGMELPTEIAATHEEYRQDQDELGRFILECTRGVEDEEHGVLRDTLLLVYRAWSKAQGNERLPTMRKMNADMKAKGYVTDAQPRWANQKRVVEGLALNNAGEGLMREAVWDAA